MGIDTLPNGSSFGLSFNYSVWTANTQVMLCNVPWNSDYRDIVKFADGGALDDYLMNHTGPTISISQLTYARVGMPVRINLPFNQVYQYNYLRVYNPAQPITGDTPRAFYYFIQDVRYIGPNVTELDIQLDVWQSFGNHVTFGNCYVERGHIGIANQNALADHGRQYLTVPEGLDIGGEYQTVYDGYDVIGRTTSSDYLSTDIIVASTVSWEGSGGTIDAPVLNTSKGATFEGLPNGCELYWFSDIADFKTMMTALTDMPWVSQGIISITAVPALALSLNVDYELITGPHSLAVKRLLGTRIPPQIRTLLYKFQLWDRYDATRYKNLAKLYTYPYSLIELTTYSGNPLIIKPEGLGDDDFKVMQLTHIVPPGPRVVFYPYHYNASGISDTLDANGNIIDDHGEFLDMMTGFFELPTFSVVNNAYLAYMAANTHSIAYQHQSADWSQQRALAGNSLAFDQASRSMDTATQSTELGVQATRQSADIANSVAAQRAVLGGIQQLGAGAAGGVTGMAGGAMAAAGGAVSAAIDVNQRNQQTAVSVGLSRGQTALGVGTSGYMRDTNRAYADFAARGDYQNAIGAINAKVQDARMIQPTTSGQLGGDAFQLATGQWAVHAKVKSIQGASLNAVGEYWLRYGYAINRFTQLPSSLQVMSKFTYWKLRETYIRSSTCPESFRQTIRGIFEKGVTVWADPADIGNIDIADNNPLNGVTL